MRIALCAIAYDKDHIGLGAMLESAKALGATDLVLAVDDRSAPDTVEWARELWGDHADVFTFEMEKDGDPDFARARNLTLYKNVIEGPDHDRRGCHDCAMEYHAPSRWAPGLESRIPEECQWWMWADSDDVIESVGGKTIPQFIETLVDGFRAAAFNYHYADDEFGNPKGHVKVRLYSTKQRWEWRDRIHEDCYPADGKRMGLDVPVTMDSEEAEFRWVHHTENKVVQPGRNFRCLRRMLADDPTYPRVWFYLGNQHFAAHNWRLAAEAYEHYIPMSEWHEERWWALVYAAIAYRAVGDIESAIDRDMEAISLMPNLVDAYFGLGESYCRKGDWQKSITWGELGIERLASEDRGSQQKAIPSNLIWFNANGYSFQPYNWLGIAYSNVGENEKSLACYEQAYKARPEPDIAKNIALLKAALNRKRITHNGIDLAAGLAKNGEPLKALDVLAALPAGSADDPNVARMGQHIARQVAHLGDRTAYQNFYFGQEETNDPLALPTTSDENLERYVPRMMWALRRLKAAGAKRVLDIGIGDGTFDFLLARHGIQVVGVDVDWRRAQNANKNAVRAGYQQEQTIESGPLVEFSGDCACDHEESDHAYAGCKIPDCVCEAKWVETQAAQTVTIPQATPNSMAQFLYSPPGQISPQVRALGPYDAVVGMELLEHVNNVEETLALMEEMAPRVLISTPDGGWNGPVSWNPGHVRAYSQRDLTRLLIQRGWLVEMHSCSRSADEQGQIVAEYVREAPQADARVVIFCPPTGDWTPDSIRTGIGGSETAVIRVAEEFAKLGKRVTVYASCEGLWSGVRYRFAEDFRPEPCEAFISWRTIGPAPQMREFAAQRFVWAHDVHFGDATPEQLDGVTVIALSEWHRGYMAERYPGAHIEVLGNGIDPERFAQDVAKEPHRMIYAHSPDRGLDRVLATFPRVRQRFPDAELHVFYGFDAARKRFPDFIDRIERMARQPGVFLHGNVGQDELAREYLKAAVDYYPAVTPDGQRFPETYCISVVEAQAAGCVPVTAEWGALAETNKFGVQLDDGEDPASAIAHAFEMGPQLIAREWALKQTWTSVAERWIALMRAPVAA